MMKRALIFAAYMPNVRRTLKYTDTIKRYFHDCDVYIGINSCTPVFKQLLHGEGFTNTIEVDRSIEVNSDASAYQAALKLLKSQGKQYDTFYFTHTKGASYPDDQQWIVSCDSYFTGFCERRSIMNDKLREPNVGGVSYVGRAEPMNGGGYAADIAKYYNPQFSEVADIMSLTTSYVIKGEIVHQFLNTVKPEFFTDRLDRYFFETSFPLIVDKYGLKRDHVHMW
jgi:hypothetical protein